MKEIGLDLINDIPITEENEKIFKIAGKGLQSGEEAPILIFTTCLVRTIRPAGRRGALS